MLFILPLTKSRAPLGAESGTKKPFLHTPMPQHKGRMVSDVFLTIYGYSYLLNNQRQKGWMYKYGAKVLFLQFQESHLRFNVARGVGF